MKRFRDYILGVLTAVMVIGLAVSAMAANYNKNVNVTYRDIKISINGNYFTPKDGNGRTVEPFIYEGTTYLPVRAVSEAVGYNVTWDNNTSVVYLSNGGSGNANNGSTGNAAPPTVNLVDTIAPYKITGHYSAYYPSSGSDSLTMGGTNYKNSFELGQNYGNESEAQFNLGGRYTLLSGIAGATDGSRLNCVLEIYGDGNLLKSVDIISGNLPANFSVNVAGVSQLSFVSDVSHDTWVGVADLKIQ